MPNVIVYSKNVCKYCTVLKNYLSEKGIEYEERNIDQNEQYRKELIDDMGYSSVPVTLINNEPVIGFDLRKLNELLG